VNENDVADAKLGWFLACLYSCTRPFFVILEFLLFVKVMREVGLAAGNESFLSFSTHLHLVRNLGVVYWFYFMCTAQSVCCAVLGTLIVSKRVVPQHAPPYVVIIALDLACTVDMLTAQPSAQTYVVYTVCKASSRALFNAWALNGYRLGRDATLAIASGALIVSTVAASVDSTCIWGAFVVVFGMAAENVVEHVRDVGVRVHVGLYMLAAIMSCLAEASVTLVFSR
jgi:hypothetical protein